MPDGGFSSMMVEAHKEAEQEFPGDPIITGGVNK
jgi:hypothetical protein